MRVWLIALLDGEEVHIIPPCVLPEGIATEEVEASAAGWVNRWLVPASNAIACWSSSATLDVALRMEGADGRRLAGMSGRGDRTVSGGMEFGFVTNADGHFRVATVEVGTLAKAIAHVHALVVAPTLPLGG